MEQRRDRLYKNLFGLGVVLLCFLLLLPTLRLMQGNAQTTPSTESSSERGLDTRIHKFFETLSSGSSSSAFTELLRQSPLGAPGAALQSTELQSKVDELKVPFGEMINWEKYDSKQIGTDIFVIRYVLKYEQHPVIWTFTFYRKPSATPSAPISNPWVLIDLRFDTDFL